MPGPRSLLSERELSRKRQERENFVGRMWGVSLWMGSAGEYGGGLQPRVFSGKLVPNCLQPFRRLDAEHPARGINPKIASAEAVAKRVVRGRGRAAPDRDGLEADRR